MAKKNDFQQYFYSLYTERGSHVVGYTKLVKSRKEAVAYVFEEYGDAFTDLVLDQVI